MGARTPPPKKKNRKKKFFGQNHLNIGHFVNFSGKYHAQIREVWIFLANIM